MGGGGGAPDTKNGEYLAPWGATGQVQKGITTYSMSANRQRPLAGTLHAAVFNTWRRFRASALYVLPPLMIAYTTMQWAIRRNEYLNSKEGRAKEGEEALTQENLGGGSVRA